ncbi:MAG: hypothetical protein ACO24P_00225 [Candidatus Nanopelagicaceae bacterium]
MQTAILNGYAYGIVRTQEVPVNEINTLRLEWARDGIVCWITNPTYLHNPKDPDDEYSMSKPIPLA